MDVVPLHDAFARNATALTVLNLHTAPNLLDGEHDSAVCPVTITDPSGSGCDEEGPDDNGVADDGGLAWVRGGTVSVEEFGGRAVRGRL